MKTKKNSVLFVLGLFCAMLNAQVSYPGISSGRYNGVHSGINNPASIVSGAKKTNINLFSASVSGNNNKSEFSLKDFDVDELKDDLLDVEVGEEITGVVNLDIVGPSATFSINDKNAFGLTSRARSMVNIQDFDLELLNATIDNEDVSTSYLIDSDNNQSFRVNIWGEVGLSYARKLWSNDKHTFKFGITAKYLWGLSNAYLNVDNLQGTINTVNGGDDTLTDASGNFTLVNSGIDFTSEDENIDYDLGKGFGGDIGFIYEYRNGKDKNWCKKCDGTSYKFKAGISVIDLGKISYTPVKNLAYSYMINVPAGEVFNFNTFDNVEDYEDVNHVLENSPYFQQSDVTGEYGVKLPTRLNVNLDYRITDSFYLEGQALIALINQDNAKDNPFYVNNYALIPRFDKKWFGIAVPVNYNELSDLNAGVTLKLGPLFVGSNSILTSWLGSGKQADAFVGIRF